MVQPVSEAQSNSNECCFIKLSLLCGLAYTLARLNRVGGCSPLTNDKEAAQTVFSSAWSEAQPDVYPPHPHAVRRARGLLQKLLHTHLGRRSEPPEDLKPLRSNVV